MVYKNDTKEDVARGLTQLTESLKDSQGFVSTAPTGCGKSIQITWYLTQLEVDSDLKLVCT